MGSWPHYIGTDQNRNFRLEEDRLILSEEETPPGGERRPYQITAGRPLGSNALGLGNELIAKLNLAGTLPVSGLTRDYRFLVHSSVNALDIFRA